MLRTMSDTPGGGEPAPAPAPDAPYPLRYLAGVLWQYRWLIVSVTATGSALVLIYLILSLILPDDLNPLPDVYRAEALLLVPRDASTPNFDSDLSGLLNRSLTGLLPGQVNNMRLALTLLNSRSTIDAVAEKFDLAERYRITSTTDVRGRVRLRFLAKASFDYEFSARTLRISYRSSDPEFAARIVNYTVETLERRFDELGSVRGGKKLALVEARHREVEQHIEKSAKRIREFQERHGVLDVNDLAREYVSRIADLNTSLLLTEVEIQTHGEVAPSNDSALLVLTKERDNLRKLIDEMESGYDEYDGGQLPAQGELPKLAQDFARLRLDQAVQIEIFKLLSREHELAKLQAMEEQEPAFQVLERAEVPDMRDGPSRRRILMAAFLASLAAGIVAALLLNTIRGRSDR